MYKEKLVKELCNRYRVTFYHSNLINLYREISALKADFLLVACWPELLPENIIHAVSCAALNLHPSLLPKYRGRDPIGDQLSVRDSQYGVTLHLLENQFDSGDIVLQQSFCLKDPASRPEIESQAAEIGARLFIEAVTTYRDPGWVLIKP